MITIDDLIAELQRLQNQGHGNAGVVVMNSNTGEIRTVSTDDIDVNMKRHGMSEPDEVEEGETYITLYSY